MPTLPKTLYLWLALLLIAIGLQRPPVPAAAPPAPLTLAFSPLWLVLGVGLVSFPLIFLALRAELPPEPVTPATPGFGVLLDCLVFYLASYQAAMLLTAHLAPTVSAIFNQGLAQVGSATLALLYLHFSIRRTGAPLRLVGERLGKDILWGVLAFVALLPVVLALEQLAQRLFAGTALPPNPVVLWLSGHPSRTERGVLFVLVALIGPAVEEVFFRGALLTALRERCPLGLRVVVATLAFALLHPLPTVLPLLALGASYTVLWERRQSIVPGLVAHLLQNTLAFVLLCGGTS